MASWPSSTPTLNPTNARRSEEHTSELQSQFHLVCRLLLEKKQKNTSAQTRNGNQPPPYRATISKTTPLTPPSPTTRTHASPNETRGSTPRSAATAQTRFRT